MRKHPVNLQRGFIVEELKISRVAANKLVNKMVVLGILQEITGKERYKIFAFVDLIKIIEKGTRE